MFKFVLPIFLVVLVSADQTKIHGGMTDEEYFAAITQLFNMVDANRDGSIDVAEYKDFTIKLIEHAVIPGVDSEAAAATYKAIPADRHFWVDQFEGYDESGDGKLTLQEALDYLDENRFF